MNLDKNQIDAINFKDCNALVVAAPGAGKTTVILKRVQHLIEEKGISENNIIILTFTKNAAVSMKRRYKDSFQKGNVGTDICRNRRFLFLFFVHKRNVVFQNLNQKIKTIGNKTKDDNS